jgi:excisionase family DNA binding protein
MSLSYGARQEAKRWAAEHTTSGTTDDVQIQPDATSAVADSSAGEGNTTALEPAQLPFLPLRTAAQTAVLLSVPENWLRRKAGRREIPFTRVGHYVRFSAEDIEAIVRDGARPAQPTPADGRTSRRRPPSRRR